VWAVLIPMLTTCRKLAMRLFVVEKTWVNHVKIVMVWGCHFCLFAKGTSCFE
jgi:hypothetical protein